MAVKFDVEIANAALHLAMEWGEDWLKPVQGRLAKQYPTLTQRELDSYNRRAQDVMTLGGKVLARLAGQVAFGDPRQPGLWEAEMVKRAAWISSDNLGRLFSQCMYYAMK